MLKMGLLPDALNCGLLMQWGCRERFYRHWLQRKPLDSDPGMPWCMSGSLNRGGGENVSGRRMRNPQFCVSGKRPINAYLSGADHTGRIHIVPVWYAPERYAFMGLLPDTQNCGLRMRRVCRKRFPHHRGLAIPTCITACRRNTRLFGDWCQSLLIILRIVMTVTS